MITLNQIYERLDFKQGGLFEAAARPERNRELRTVWQEKGEWLSAAKQAGAERVFFVDNNPVIVFTKITSGILADKIQAFNHAWCLARPRILFLESLGELTVLDLAKAPIRLSSDEKSLEEQWNKHRILLETTSQVSNELQKFHRDNIESGKIYSEKFFGGLDDRADVALLRDLKTIRNALIGQGLTATLAHALIGRCIFVRYLEDRKILTEEDFQNIARKVKGRTDLLRTENPSDLSEGDSCFIKILQDKEFTYDLFGYLARHFNGDMFPSDGDENKRVHKKHLNTVHDMLLGNIDTLQKLFFYAYRFDIIPLDLISAIYEEFYSLEEQKTQTKKGNSQRRADGAYYTPPALAEFVCSRVLSPEILNKKPRILDPACGSGIFLVEAFRRIVRHRVSSQPTTPLNFEDLKTILKEQIAGIEANPEAAKVAAFSLCLAMLHYLKPPDIRTQIYENKNKLPHLLASTKRSQNHFHCILAENAFDVEKIESSPMWKERFGNQCADVIIGNPPWGSPGAGAPQESKKRHEVLLQWVKNNGKPIGDKEASQGFIWRTLDFLKSNGICGILVPASVLTKQGKPSRQFLSECFSQIKIKEMFNFSHVRKEFFRNSNSPFLFFSYCKGSKVGDEGSLYWSVKASQQVKKINSITVSANDRFWVPARLVGNPTIWKTLLYGSHSDVDLIDRLWNVATCFENYIETSGQGLIKGSSGGTDSTHLIQYPCLETSTFTRYDSLSYKTVPTTLYRHGIECVYSGKRLLIKRGITERGEIKGLIIARYEKMPFCFSNAINGFILKDKKEQTHKILLGIFLSSLARYFFFNTSSKWGVSHHEIHLHEILKFPIIFPGTQKQASEIVRLVDCLRNYNPPIKSLVKDGVRVETIHHQRSQWEAELDDVIFDLYQLNNQERDLIRDCCNITIPFFYDPIHCEGAQAFNSATDGDFQDYAETFCRRWEPYLDDGTKMCWQGFIGAGDNMVAAHFFITDKAFSRTEKPTCSSWDDLLASLKNSMVYPHGTSRLIIEGLVHLLTDDGIVIIKRNEKRFWTKSKAREDAESTLCKSMMSDDLSSKKGGR